MANEPISNPPIPPTRPPVDPSRESPMTGAGEDAQPKPFSLSPEAPNKGAQAPEGARPSPMDAARDSARGNEQWSTEEMTNNLQNLQDKLGQAKTVVQDPTNIQKLTDDHYTALGTLVGKLNPDLKAIAKNTGSDFNPPQPPQGQGGMLNFVANWIGAGQDSLSGALNYISNTDKPDMTSFLKTQFAVQRATQRVELFSSIIGSSVSGIKTLMSTQLG